MGTNMEGVTAAGAGTRSAFENRVDAQGTRAGTGYSENTDSRTAGTEAARAALSQTGGDSCDLVLLFATDKHDPVLVRAGVRSVVGPGPRIVGGASMGVMTSSHLGYEGYQVGVAVIKSESMRADLFVQGGVAGNEYDVGCALGAQIHAAATAGAFVGEPNLLLLYDIVNRGMSEGFSLNMATPLLAGIEKSLGKWPRTAGGGLMGSMQWNPGFQWFDDRIEQHNAMALVFHGGVRMDATIIHGCKPSSVYHTITKADHNVVLELDGEPILDVVARLSGSADASDWRDYPLFITLGINNGERFGEYREDDYAVRLCMDVDMERRGLVFFGDDLQAGTVVQLMRRSIDYEYIRQRAEALLGGLDGRRPFLALYLDCAGRASAFCGSDREEAEEVQKAVGPNMPLLGWYVGCEIAKAGSVMQSHNWTGILCVLSE